MLIDWLPQSCSTQRIFVSYPSDQRPLAEEIAQTLKNDGHEVFFDQDSLPAAGDYNERIRKAIAGADRCVVLINKAALIPGKYTLTELDFIKDRWPAPAGRVFPVLIDGSAQPAELPTYLRSVQAIQVKGNATAEVAATVERARGIRPVCTLCIATAALGLAGLVTFGAARTMMPGLQAADVKLVPIENAHFRPRAKPPADLKTDSQQSWVDSPLTVTLMKVAYNNRNEGGARARLLAEDVTLKFGTAAAPYKWAYVVDIPADGACADWLCSKGNVAGENIEPGKLTVPRETMFLPAGGEPLTWKSFIDQVLAPGGPAMATLSFKGTLESTAAGKPTTAVVNFECKIDVAAARERFAKRGFKPGTNPRPIFWQPPCVGP
jgi:hypothetical protein